AAASAKPLVRRVMAGGPAEALDADNAALIAALRVSPEGQEGLAAFLGTRAPAWIDSTACVPRAGRPWRRLRGVTVVPPRAPRRGLPRCGFRPRARKAWPRAAASAHRPGSTARIEFRAPAARGAGFAE